MAPAYIESKMAPAYIDSKMAPPDYSDADSDSEPRQGGIGMTRIGGGYNDCNDTTDNNEDEGPTGDYP